jgi:hypothetical protein
MVEEYTSIMRNDFWDIVSRPKGKSVVSSKMLYKKFKVRFMVRGLS